MFKDRFDAAAQLLPYLKKYTNDPSAIIIAIPRGGLEVGYILSRELHLPLDISLTKKIGYPGNPEYAIGAVSLQNFFIEEGYAATPDIQDYLNQQISQTRQLLEERNKLYKQNRPAINLFDKIAIVVDDGAATGNTLLMTLKLIRKDRPQKIVVAIPVAPQSALERLQTEADEIICLEIPTLFYAIGQFYEKFDQVDDKEALRLLHEANK